MSEIHKISLIFFVKSCKIMRQNIEHILKQRILILDGAMGTMIQRYKLQEKDFRGTQFVNSENDLKGNNDLLSITRPDIIKSIHGEYLQSGADIIETNTFSGTTIAQADYKLESAIYDINFQSAKIAKEAAKEFSTPEKPRFVAGAIGPTNRTASISPKVEDPSFRHITFDDLRIAYKQQVEALLDGNVDLLLVETVFDTLNCKAALFAISEVFEEKEIEVPIMVSGTITDESGRTLSGQTAEAFLNSVSHIPLLSIGFNCALGTNAMRPYIKELSDKSEFFISAYPNAGLPNEMGEYDETSEIMGKQLEDFMNSGLVNIVGGCCGTTPDHIAEFSRIAAKYKAREIPTLKTQMKLSGLEAVTITEESNFLNIGERTNVMGSIKFRRLIKEDDFEQALSVALQQVESGAQVIDINMDDGLIEGVESMVHFLNLTASDPDISRVPVMIDSSKWEIIEEGLKCLQGKGIVNSISLKEGEEVFIKHAKTILKYGAAVVVMAFDEKGQAVDYKDKIRICERAYNILTKEVGFPAEDIIFDPNILTVATGIEEHNNYAVDFFKATKWIKENLPYAKVSGGVSNVSFSFRGGRCYTDANMNVKSERIPQSQIVLHIEIDPERVERSMDQAYHRLSIRTRIPGFRRGKVPRDTLERYIGRASLLQEALDLAVEPLQEDRLGAGVPAPDATPEGRDHHQGEDDPEEQQEDHPEVLRVEGRPEEVEAAMDDVQEDRRGSPDLDEGEREVDHEESGEDHVADVLEASADVGRLHEVPGAVRVERPHRGLVQDGEALLAALAHGYCSAFSPMASAMTSRLADLGMKPEAP